MIKMICFNVGARQQIWYSKAAAAALPNQGVYKVYGGVSRETFAEVWSLQASLISRGHSIETYKANHTWVLERLSASSLHPGKDSLQS